MGRRARLLPLILGAVLLCAACTGREGLDFLQEIPKNFALQRRTPEAVSGEASEETASEETESGEAASEETESGEAASGEAASGEASSEEASSGEAAFGEALKEAAEEVPEADFLMEEAYPYAFGCLSGPEQVWYRDMERILGSFGEGQELSKKGLEAGLDEESIDRIFQCVLNDHPELFYVEGYSYTRYLRGETLTAIEFSGSYNVSLEEAKRRAEEIAGAADRILAGVLPEASDYEKVKYVYDTLIRETDYDLDSTDNQNVYSVFVNHFSVCQGYAKATQYLLNRLGVPCTLVLGTVETGEGHAWNLVEIDGDFYYVDTTWGDVSYQEDDADTEGAGGQIAMPEINYDYLNVTTRELLRTHTIGGEVPMPECTATGANYYVREGAYFTSYDREQVAELFRRAEEEGRRDVTVKCADRFCYEAVTAGLIQNQDVFRYLTEAERQIAYTQNEKQLSLTFWVTNE